MKKMMFAAIAALFCLASVASAQDMESMKPPAEVKANLGFFLGHWTGKVKMMMGGGADSNSVIDSEFALGDRYMQSKINYDLGGMQMKGLHMLTFDPDTKKYKAWWFDSSANGVLDMEGDLNGDTLVLTSKPTKMPGMGDMIMRTTWVKKSDTEIVFTLESKTGDSFSKLMEGTYKKG